MSNNQIIQFLRNEASVVKTMTEAVTLLDSREHRKGQPICVIIQPDTGEEELVFAIGISDTSYRIVAMDDAELRANVELLMDERHIFVDPIIIDIPDTIVDRAIGDEYGNNIANTYSTYMTTIKDGTNILYVEDNKHYTYSNPITEIEINLSLTFDEVSLCVINFTAGDTITPILDMQILGLFPTDFVPNAYHEIILYGRFATINTIMIPPNE